MPFDDANLAETLRSQLASGEQVLWHGRPRQGLLLYPADALLIPFSLLWGGFAISWEWQALHTGDGFLMLWGIPFVLVGLYLMVGRFWVDARRRARTYYALTDERVLIVADKQLQSLALRQLPAASLSLRRTGQGSITFAQTGGWIFGATLLPPSWPGVRDALPQLDHIDDAQRVFACIRDAQRRIGR